MKVLVRLKSNTLLDLDDAEYLRKDDRTLKYLIQHSSRCTVGSDALHEYCSILNGNIFKSTSPVKDHDVVRVKARRSTHMHIGWVGDTGNGNPISKEFAHKRSLYELLFPAILASKVTVKLSLLGVKNPTDIPEIYEYFKDAEHVEVSIPTDLKWENDTWLYTEISRMDFGLSPMVDHPFTQAKSAFKAKQYLSVGVPVIASAVGENDKFVEHNVNGIICASKDDFVKALLTADTIESSMYEQWSAMALSTKDKYAMKSYCSTLMGFLSTVDNEVAIALESAEKNKKPQQQVLEID